MILFIVVAMSTSELEAEKLDLDAASLSKRGARL